ncbi:hypothetical protein [Breznakia pachnodae]|uniref:ABC-type multidrug transport system fused ATPase/permease subunit n=1 Tax=Breznakia pachnodae TaxID=265178 RepID=A0ABU0E341_9FIRM|nr:hypothetical protein [Breznakia pachnodae]MDQ0361306.1 ABC-type multidrug transport system fused ATPase/permease subunit [Breznakia pachnodae]
MSDEQIESMVDNYFIKSMIITIAGYTLYGIICITYVFILYQTNNKSLLFLMPFIIMAFLLVLILIATFISMQLPMFIKIIDEDCDYESYKKALTYGYEKNGFPKPAREIMLQYYVDCCVIGGNVGRVRNFFDDEQYQNLMRKNIFQKEWINFRIAIIENDDEQLEKSYQLLNDFISKKNNSRFQQIKKILDIKYAEYNHEYETAIQIIEETKAFSKSDEIDFNMRKGSCLYKLGRCSDAKSYLEFVLENGNTLPQVKEAKAILLELN